MFSFSQLFEMQENKSGQVPRWETQSSFHEIQKYLSVVILSL